MKKSCRIGISNMHCSNCAAAIERHFNQLEDIKVNVVLSENEGLFTYDDEKWNEKAIEKHLKSIGYPRVKDNEKRRKLVQMILCILIMVPFVIHMILMATNDDIKEYGYIQFALATVVEIIAGGPFFLGMIRDFKNKRLGMDVLVTLGTLTAYIYSSIILLAKLSGTLYFHTSVMLLTVILIGKYIESSAKRKTASSLKGLMALQEKKANVIIDNAIEEKDINDVNINDIVIVSIGQRVPLDGIIIDGNVEVDESMITGESLPVNKTNNDKLLAGTIVIQGNAKIKVTNNHDDTYLSSIIKKVEDIQSQKPQLQRTADKIASFFVPIVIGLSLIAFVITYFTSKDKQLNNAIVRAIAVLMISCPCSLGLATPLSILVGSSRAIKLGIIYNNIEIFEKANDIDAVCFDKTGTLSEGKLEVTMLETNNDKALDIIYSLESVSTHPIAKSIIEYCKVNNAKLLDLKASEIVGKGITSDNYFLYKQDDQIILKENDEIIATLTVKDKIKNNSKQVIEGLKEIDIDVYMLTGDNQNVALDVAKELSIDKEHVFYEIKPDQKLSIIENIQKQGNRVAFVGDGINDALALNAANLSIAMGSGTEIAMNSSDITIANSNLESITKSIRLSKKVYRNIIMNFVWAFSYNIIAIPLAMCGVINPMIAGICMAFSNIAVVLNSLRLYKVKIGD